MKEEKIEFYNKKNQKIVGLLSFPKEKNQSIVIIIHGFKGTKEYYPFVNNSILILRGSKDEVVGIGKDKEAVKLLNAEYKIIEKGDHNFTDKNSEKKLIKLTVGWFNRVLK